MTIGLTGVAGPERLAAGSHSEKMAVTYRTDETAASEDGCSEHRRLPGPHAWSERLPEIAFGVSFVVGLIVMIAVPRWQGVPFHLIWAGVTILYAYRQWSPRPTAMLLVVVCVLTGAIVAMANEGAKARLLELADLPMMALMFLVMVRVVHQRSEALVRVRRAADREREFVRDASHQLRTPITIARGHVEMMVRGDSGPDAADAAIVLEELGRLQHMSDRLLLLASAEYPGFLVLEPLALAEFVETAAARWTAVADRAWIVHASVAGRVLADRERMSCALDTLIENAIKATRPGEAIALVALARGDVPVLLVADRGIGIREEQRERIFERFARGATVRGRPWGGTGLGLPLVRAIAEAHGGTAVLVESVDGWTQFELRLPRFETALDVSRVI
jgi:signal transduction histidine kinase